MAVGCLSSAAFSLGSELIGAKLTGAKLDVGGMLANAGMACLAGALAPFLGEIGGAVLDRLLSKTAAEAASADGWFFSDIGNYLRDETGAVRLSGYTPDQDAVIQLAKAAQRRGGVTAAEAQILRDWAREYRLSSRGPEAHPNRPFGRNPHIHVGPVNHIPVKP